MFILVLLIRRPPRSTRTDTLFPYTTLFRARLQIEGDHILALLAELGDAKVHLIARLEEDHRRLLPLADARRGAGDQQIARMERDEAADIGDAFRDRENHRPGVAGLPPLAVDVEEHVQRLAVTDLSGRSEGHRVGQTCDSTV